MWARAGLQAVGEGLLLLSEKADRLPAGLPPSSYATGQRTGNSFHKLSLRGVVQASANSSDK